MHISLEGKHALVGGSSKGIGRAIALQLAHSGAQVTFAARSESGLKELCDKLQKSTGRSHRYLVVDYTDLQGYKALIHSYIKKHPVDILVNNTQGLRPAPAWKRRRKTTRRPLTCSFKQLSTPQDRSSPICRRGGLGPDYKRGLCFCPGTFELPGALQQHPRGSGQLGRILFGGRGALLGLL